MKKVHKKDNKFMLIALELSKKSDMNNKHGCVIVDKKGNIISSGFNKYVYLSQDKIKIFNKNTGIKISKHAEEEALKNVNPKKLFGAKLYIVRSCNDNTSLFTYSKPCKRCTTIIETCMNKCGLKVVYYS
jgi:deoxycytidylate deaminase